MILMVTALALAFWVPCYADAFTRTVTLPIGVDSDGITTSGGIDSWMNDAYNPQNQEYIRGQSLNEGDTLTVDITFQPGFLATDRIGDDNEYFDVELVGGGGGAGSMTATLTGYLTINGQEIDSDPNTRVSGTAPISGSNGRATFHIPKSWLAAGGQQEITDMHFVLGVLGSGTWMTGPVKAGLGADGLYPRDVPEPSTILSALLGLAGFAVRKFRKA